jgi:hypothetical protein
LPGHARLAETSRRDGTPASPCGRPRVRHPGHRLRDTSRMHRGGGVAADRDVRSPTERQGNLMRIGDAADTSNRQVLRESWAEPPLPPLPEPPLPLAPETPVPPPPFPPSPPTSSGEGCTWTGAGEEGQAVDAYDALRLHAPWWRGRHPSPTATRLSSRTPNSLKLPAHRLGALHQPAATRNRSRQGQYDSPLARNKFRRGLSGTPTSARGTQ